MKIIKNIFNRWEIEGIKDSYQKEGKTLSGIASYSNWFGTIACCFGWAIKCENKNNYPCYLIKSSALKYLSRHQKKLDTSSKAKIVRAALESVAEQAPSKPISKNLSKQSRDLLQPSKNENKPSTQPQSKEIPLSTSEEKRQYALHQFIGEFNEVYPIKQLWSAFNSNEAWQACSSFLDKLIRPEFTLQDIYDFGNKEVKRKGNNSANIVFCIKEALDTLMNADLPNAKKVAKIGDIFKYLDPQASDYTLFGAALAKLAPKQYLPSCLSAIMWKQNAAKAFLAITLKQFDQESTIAVFKVFWARYKEYNDEITLATILSSIEKKEQLQWILSVLPASNAAKESIIKALREGIDTNDTHYTVSLDQAIVNEALTEMGIEFNP